MENVEARCAIADRDRAHAAAAAAWIVAFHPGIATRVEDGTAVLTAAAGHTEARLRTIWRSGLLNERLVAENEAGRTAVLDALVR